MNEKNIPPEPRTGAHSGSHARILVFRSARLWQVHAAVSALKEANAADSIDVIAQPSAASAAAVLPEVNAVVEYPGEAFRFKRTPLRLLMKLRRARYDTIVIVYNNVYGEGYHSVRLIAQIAGAPRVLTFNLDGEWAILRDAGKSPHPPLPLTILMAACVAAFTLLYLPFGFARLLACRASRRGRMRKYIPADPPT